MLDAPVDCQCFQQAKARNENPSNLGGSWRKCRGIEGLVLLMIRNWLKTILHHMLRKALVLRQADGGEGGGNAGGSNPTFLNTKHRRSEALQQSSVVVWDQYNCYTLLATA